MLERRGINAMNERKHPEAGVFTGCILWPTDPVTRCSAAVVPALQPAAASSCCSKPCYDAAVHNASMKRLAWQLLCFAPSTTDLPTKTSGDILTISISCRAGDWYLQWAQLLQAPAAVCSQLLSPVLLSNWVRRGRGGELHLLLSSSGPSHHII